MPPDPSTELIKAAVADAEPGVVPTAKVLDSELLPTRPPGPLDPVAPRAPTHNRAPEVGSTVKHYELLRKLGEGGMGTVYVARDTTLGRLVAIKVLQLQSGPNAERFLIEAQATARCRHDNIVVIHEVDELHGYPYMVLEYLEGRTLREWMAQRDPSSEPVSPSLAVELLLPVVRALSCAHQLGIVHRDLKPENIFLTEAGRVVVLDFGIAKRIEAHKISAINATARRLAKSAGLTQDGALIGTLPYMSPEQLRAEDVDARSDLWTVGILLYELVTGAHPLTYRSVFELLEIGESDDPMPSVRDKQPDVGALGAIIDRCLQKPRARRYGSAAELVAALEALAHGGKASELGEDESPFAGLSAFQEADAERYVGREREVVGLVGRLRNQPLVVVAGPSGAGKSSFVRAGVIPALKRSGEPWEAFIVRPGRRPLAALADVVAQIAPATQEGALAASSIEAVLGALPTQPGLVGALLRARCRREGGRHRILLFVDQFEELYTLGADVAERAAFVACLEGAADDASSPLRVMLSLRSDFLYRMAEDRHFLAEVTRGLVFLLPMGRDGLRAALTRPLEVAGYRFENEAMVEAMVGGLERTKSPLPLLQFTAAKLWEARDRTSRLLTQASYDQLGGVAGALSAHANAVLSALSVADQRLCRAVLLRLCTPERTRAVVSLADLRGLAADGGAVEQVIHRLSDARLVLIEAGGEREGTTVELCHESLIESWDKLTQWLTESEHDAQFVARLHVAAQQWEASQEAQGLLWRDRAAREAAEWLTRRRAEQAAGESLGLGTREERFLVAVVALSERGRRRRQRIMAGVLAIVSLVAVVVSVLGVRERRAATLAEQQSARAERQSARADQETAFAQKEALQARNATRMAASREFLGDPTTVLALLREVELTDVPRGWAELARWASQARLARVVLTHPDAVQRAVWSPDGEHILTASSKMAFVWRADGTGDPLVLRGHDGSVTYAAWSPDGKRIVTASRDKTVRVWSADGSSSPIVFRGHENDVASAAFSHDGQRIVTASWDKTVRVWSADGKGQSLILRGHESAVNEASFSPDDKRIVTASNDMTARVWSADGIAAPIVLRDHVEKVSSAAWSPDGKHIATGSIDKTVRVWSADGKGQPVILRHEFPVISVAVSPDGKRIVSTSWDKLARVWSVDGTGEPLVLRGHQNDIASAAWSPDGKWIVTASFDKTARVWKADGRTGGAMVLRGHTDGVAWGAWSPDGKWIATASLDRTARVWRADGTGQPVILRGHEEEVHCTAWSPDGKRILTASLDRTARVWNADGTGQPLIFRGHDASVSCAAWSPDGKRMVTASRDRTARVWNADGTGQPTVLRGHENELTSAEFSPDGERILTASFDKTARVWNVDGTGEPVVLRGHEGTIFYAAWSPDGRRIATASEDKTARVWNADGTGEPLVLRGHEDALISALWSPDGKRIVTASEDKTVRVWSADGTGELLVLRGADQGYSWAAFRPDGKSISAASDDKTVWVWTDIEPLHGVDDPRLWTATTYCPPVELRIRVLNVPDATARTQQEACLRHVKAARGERDPAGGAAWPSR
jgi:WD40 repeat protein